MVKDERLANSKLRNDLEKEKLKQQLESPTFKVKQLRLSLEREVIQMAEKTAKFEKEAIKLREELHETKCFYEEQISSLNSRI